MTRSRNALFFIRIRQLTHLCRRTLLLPIVVWLAVTQAASSVGAQEPTASASPAPGPSPAVSYRISIEFAPRPTFLVNLTVYNAPSGPQEFAIPAWTPGYYQILNYQDGIRNVRAQGGDGRILDVKQTGARVWQVSPAPAADGATLGSSLLRMTYEVLPSDEGLGFFGSVLRTRDRIGYINGASAFLYWKGHTDAPVTLSVSVPSAWNVTTPLSPAPDAPPKSDENPAQPGEKTSRYEALGYDALIDCPIQMGRFTTFSFDVASVPFQCIVVGKNRLNQEQTGQALGRIVKSAFGLFRGERADDAPAPFSRYTYFFHMGEDGFYGGLEHRNSTVIHLNSLVSERDTAFLEICAHELLHAWNVKAMRPEGLGPFDYTQPVRSPSIWFAEGVTDYYAMKLLPASGLRDQEWFLKSLELRIGDLDGSPSRNSVSLREASLHAWEGGSSGYKDLDYYTKGSLAALCFDIRIRSLTHGKRSLDDVMRRMYDRYGRTYRPYPESAVLAALNAVSGVDLTEEYRNLVDRTEEMPWDVVLPQSGLVLTRVRKVDMGVEMADSPGASGRAVVERVAAGKAGEKLGLQAGDTILRIDDKPVLLDDWNAMLDGLSARAPISLDVERSTQLIHVEGTTGVSYSQHSLRQIPASQLTPGVLQVRRGLLEGSARPSVAGRAVYREREDDFRRFVSVHDSFRHAASAERRREAA